MTKLKFDDVNDSELLMLYQEEDENAKNILYYKYNFIIDVLIKKYKSMIIALNIDFQEIYSECSVGFSDALKHYNEEKNASLATFITLCIERRIKGIIRKFNRKKSNNQKVFSLDFTYDEIDNSLMDIVSDNGVFDPLNNLAEKEKCHELLKYIKENLTKREYDVFILMLNDLNYGEIAKILNKSKKQIDNTIQRVKTKVKKFTNFSQV